MNVGEIEEKIGKKDYRSNGPRRGSEIDHAGARPLAVERSSWDNDDRNDERGGSRHGGPANWEEFTAWQWLTMKHSAPRYPF